MCYQLRESPVNADIDDLPCQEQHIGDPHVVIPNIEFVDNCRQRRGDDRSLEPAEEGRYTKRDHDSPESHILVRWLWCMMLCCANNQSIPAVSVVVTMWADVDRQGLLLNHVGSRWPCRCLRFANPDMMRNTCM